MKKKKIEKDIKEYACWVNGKLSDLNRKATNQTEESINIRKQIFKIERKIENAKEIEESLDRWSNYTIVISFSALLISSLALITSILFAFI